MEPIGIDQTILGEYLDKKPVVIQLGKNKMMSIDRNNNIEYRATIMHSIRLNTYYRHYIDPNHPKSFIVPTFEDNPDALYLDLQYNFPMGTKLVFITKHNQSSVQKCFMVMMIDNEIWSPPMPNIHADGTFCMGSYYDKELNFNENKAEAHEEAIEYIRNSEWNTDLLNSRIASYLKFYETEDNEWSSFGFDTEQFKRDGHIINTEDTSWLQQ